MKKHPSIFIIIYRWALALLLFVSGLKKLLHIYRFYHEVELQQVLTAHGLEFYISQHIILFSVLQLILALLIMVPATARWGALAATLFFGAIAANAWFVGNEQAVLLVNGVVAVFYLLLAILLSRKN